MPAMIYCGVKTEEGVLMLNGLIHLADNL